MSDKFIWRSDAFMYALVRCIEFDLEFGFQPYCGPYSVATETPDIAFTLRVVAARDSRAALTFCDADGEQIKFTEEELTVDIHYFRPDGTYAPDFFMSNNDLWAGLYDMETEAVPPDFDTILQYLIPAKHRDAFQAEIDGRTELTKRQENL